MSWRIRLLPPVLAGLVIAFLTVFLFAPGGNSDHAPIIGLDKSELDFGVISGFDTVSDVLTLSNPSAERVQFQVMTDCSCTTAQPMVGVLEPLSEAHLRISYKATGQGDVHSSMNDESNVVSVQTTGMQGSSLLQVPLRARVFKPFVLDERSLVFRARCLEPVQFRFSLSLRGDVTSIELVEFPKYISQAVLGAIDPTFHAATVEGSFSAPSNVGTTESRWLFKVHLEGSTDATEVSIPAKLLVREPFEISKSFLRIAAGESQRIEIIPAEYVQSQRLELVGSLPEFLTAKFSENRFCEISVLETQTLPENSSDPILLPLNVAYTVKGGTSTICKSLPVSVYSSK